MLHDRVLDSMIIGGGLQVPGRGDAVLRLGATPTRQVPVTGLGKAPLSEPKTLTAAGSK